MLPLFQAVIESTEEAIYNSLFMATTVKSTNVETGKLQTVNKLPLKQVCEILKDGIAVSPSIGFGEHGEGFH